MKNEKLLQNLRDIIDHAPDDWKYLTTHRLDIYNEEAAKTEFLEAFEKVIEKGISDTAELNELPTAYDYIRLGHPLSSVLEWAIAKMNGLPPRNVISFSSRTVPVLAVLRKNLFDRKPTRILHRGKLPEAFDPESVRRVYGYDFEIEEVKSAGDVSKFDGTTVFVAGRGEVGTVELNPNIDFFVGIHEGLGSILAVNVTADKSYIAAIQHVRRRETIAMTPSACYSALQQLTGGSATGSESGNVAADKAEVLKSIRTITNTQTDAVLGSSGLSVQYAIMMGLIDYALENHPGKPIKIIVPPNCYGGTNDQARRVAACLDHVEILDLPVDGDNDMTDSTNRVLDRVAEEDAVPYIIAEIPTNPRVEVPDLEALRAALSKKRKTPAGTPAVDPVFILDQTFCPNVQFLGDAGILSSVRTISYVSGSKFPSGGKCTAGYCVVNKEAEPLMEKIDKHLRLCDNEATNHQVQILAEQMPSMIQRIQGAYQNTRTFVNFIEKTLPAAKINFVSEELANRGFTPSVFSLDLPTKGNSEAEREAYKRAMNHELIRMMITEIPTESKHCVSYGQLKGCYWTIPATSTQGTTKEADKDYIARVSVSPDLDLDRHKEVFTDFVAQM
ncbi:MAG: PLP-dependent transferase [Flavobacteriales bacterium]|nr:PLP-dependent transferase [Flavobacteriales bacterium]